MTNVEKKEDIRGTAIAAGAACIVAAVIAGTGLDGMYVLWSALTFEHRTSDLMVAGAPLSFLSPILIWAAFALGGVLIAIGLRVSLRWPQRSDSGNGQPQSTEAAVEDTLRAWQRKR
jgi:hypothetical protein